VSCQAINDVRESVRCLAAQLIGTMTGIRQRKRETKSYGKERERIIAVLVAFWARTLSFSYVKFDSQYRQGWKKPGFF
jgi:hypothetical protein